MKLRVGYKALPFGDGRWSVWRVTNYNPMYHKLIRITDDEDSAEAAAKALAAGEETP